MIRIVSRTLARSFFGVMIAWMLPSCVDTSPIDYHAPVQPDAGSGDAATRADPALIEECRQCVTEGACKSSYDPCGSNATCLAFTDCLFAGYCISPPGDISDIAPCLLECGQKAGLLSQTDPAIVPYLAVSICAKSTDGCASVCEVVRDR